MALFDIPSNEKTYAYTKKINIPQYAPGPVKPNVDALANYQKYSKLIKEINDADISEEDKKFLRFAATRHIVFNYNMIADYYAHSDAKVQELMEHSALVILDIDDAIANGYVQLSKSIEHIMNTSGVPTNAK